MIGLGIFPQSRVGFTCAKCEKTWMTSDIWVEMALAGVREFRVERMDSDTREEILRHCCPGCGGAVGEAVLVVGDDVDVWREAGCREIDSAAHGDFSHMPGQLRGEGIG